MRVFDPSVIDREKLSFYRLTITATDSAFPATYRRNVSCRMTSTCYVFCDSVSAQGRIE